MPGMLVHIPARWPGALAQPGPGHPPPGSSRPPGGRRGAGYRNGSAPAASLDAHHDLNDRYWYI